MVCERCGANVDMEKRRCLYCGFQPPSLHPVSEAPPEPERPVVVNVYNTVYQPPWPERSAKSRWVALLLCLFFGYSGAHKFYLGKPGAGVLYLLTFGLFGFGWVVDFIALLFGAARGTWGRRPS